jgi:hypothetical protein
LQAFVLAITIEFEKEDERDSWLELWAKNARYVAENEPRTLCYEAMIADTNPNKIMIFERCVPCLVWRACYYKRCGTSGRQTPSDVAVGSSTGAAAGAASAAAAAGGQLMVSVLSPFLRLRV